MGMSHPPSLRGMQTLNETSEALNPEPLLDASLHFRHSKTQ